MAIEESTLQKPKVIQREFYEGGVIIEFYDNGRAMIATPDWETRLATLKIITSMLPNKIKNEVLDGVGLTKEQVIQNLNEALKYVKDKEFLRYGATRKRWAILKRDKFTCQYCGSKAPEVKLHVDHKIPVSKGGNSKDDNLITACERCNQGKNVDVL